MHANLMRALLAAVSLCALALNVSAADSAADAASIRKTFGDYQKALLDGDGAKAAEVVSARTIAYYDDALTQALSTPREKLAKLDIITKLMVLRLRHEFDKARLTGMSGRELLVFAVDKGWISKSSVASFEGLEIEVDGPKASAEVAAFPGVPLFHFVKEGGQWKLDLVESFGLAGQAFGQEVAKSGMPEEEFLLRILGVLSPDRKVDERILAGPRE